jgi:hypothetical protein
MSSVDLSKINILKSALDSLAVNLKNNLKEVRKDIKKARDNTREYGKLYRRFCWLPSITYYFQLDPLGYDCFIDTYDFVEKLKQETTNNDIKTDCTNVMNAVNETVIANKALATDPSYGLHLYFPQLRCQYDKSIWRFVSGSKFREIPQKYEELSLSQDTEWDEFLKEYLRI